MENGTGKAKGGGPVRRPVEEFAELQGVEPAVFAAVMESTGWAGGKVVDKREFDGAVKSFLGAPMGGKA